MKARTEAAIEKKVAGQPITVAGAPPEGGAQIIDLTQVLRAGLEQPPRGKAGASEAGKAPGPITRKK